MLNNSHCICQIIQKHPVHNISVLSQVFVHKMRISVQALDYAATKSPYCSKIDVYGVKKKKKNQVLGIRNLRHDVHNSFRALKMFNLTYIRSCEFVRRGRLLKSILTVDLRKMFTEQVQPRKYSWHQLDEKKITQRLISLTRYYRAWPKFVLAHNTRERKIRIFYKFVPTSLDCARTIYYVRMPCAYAQIQIIISVLLNIILYRLFVREPYRCSQFDFGGKILNRSRKLSGDAFTDLYAKKLQNTVGRQRFHYNTIFTNNEHASLMAH